MSQTDPDAPDSTSAQLAVELLDAAKWAVMEWRLHGQLTDSCRVLEAAIAKTEAAAALRLPRVEVADPLRALVATWREHSWHATTFHACADELDALLQSAKANTTNLLGRLAHVIAKWRIEADETYDDGDFCCAQTRHHDADELAEALLNRPRRVR